MLNLKIYEDEITKVSINGDSIQYIHDRLWDAGFDVTRPYETTHVREDQMFMHYRQEFPYTRHGQFMDKLYALRNKYTATSGGYPKTVFVGREELNLIQLAFKYEVGGMVNSKTSSIMGMEVVETIYDNYLSVGVTLVSEE